MSVRYLLLVSLLAANVAAGELSDTEVREAYRKSHDYEKMEAFDDAVRSLLLVHGVDPKDYGVNLRLGWLYYKSERYANARHHYKAAMAASPGSLEAKLGYMLPLLAQTRYGEVESLAYKILSVDPYNYYGNLRLAFALRMQGKHAPAERVLKKMLALYPTDVPYLTELALLKEQTGAKKSARSRFQSVVALDPENVTARSHLLR